MAARTSAGWSEIVAGHRQRQLEAIGLAAFDLVDQRGLAHVTMADLAQAVGISRPTLYKYVASVEAALADFIVRRTALFETELAQALAAATDPAAQLDAYVAVTLGHVGHEQHAGALALLNGGRLSPTVDAVVHAHVRKSQAALAAILSNGIHAGLIRPDLNVDAAALLIQRMLVGAGDLPPDEATATETTLALVRALVWRGVAG